MRNYSLATLEKMLSRWKTKYYEETAKPHNPRGYRLPSLAAWDKARTRVLELEAAIAEKKKEMKYQ